MTGSIATRPIVLELQSSEVSMPYGVNEFCCPDCGDPLDLHQPEMYDATKMLGVCEECGNWYYMLETGADWSKALLIQLPKSGVVEAKLTPKLATA